MSLQNFPCSVCENPILMHECHRKRLNHVYCSDGCRGTAHIRMQCAECSNTFLVSGISAGQAKFCSEECRRARNRREQNHKKGKLATKTCERCNKVFRVRPSIAKVQRYCSQKCSSVEIGKKHQGKNSPVWKEKLKITCAHCGKEFEVHPSRSGRRKYCCKKHRILGNLQRLASGKRTDIEKAMAAALDEHAIEYDEQVVMYEKFMVDFKLRHHDVIIQCDGLFWHDRPHVRSRDRGQDRYLSKCGYIVLRFDDEKILNQMESTIVEIERTIKTGQMQLIAY